jgi:hypothetical protein
MSSGSGRAYGVGQRNGRWGVEALSWRTGASKFFARAEPHACSDTALGYLDAGGVRSVFDPVLTELPLSCENSAYAATEIGPGGTIWTGTFLGLTIYRRR